VYVPPGQYALTISSSPGGSVTSPSEGISTYDEGTVVNLVATPDIDYYFVAWTGDVYSIANINAANTTITMYANYFITANFSQGQFIENWYDLDGIRDELDGYYILKNDLNCTTPGYAELASPTANHGEGWQPIGVVDSFTGTLDGRGRKICDLFIYRPAESMGLFGYVAGEGELKDIGMVNVTVTGYRSVGGLAGANGGTISDCYATGNVTGDRYVGGLVGSNGGSMTNCYGTANVSGSIAIGCLVGSNGGTMIDCYATASVTGGAAVGGLIGENSGSVTNCYATGSITSEECVGGLVGQNGGTLSQCWATCDVTGDYDAAGGLVGENWGGTVRSCHSGGIVTGGRDVGGLVGWSLSLATISNCYATANVTGDHYVGGLLAWNSWSTVSNCYAVGDVNDPGADGGLVGLNDYGTVSNSFWDIETSGQAASDGGTGKTTAEMKDTSTFSGAAWDVVGVANPTIRNLAYIWNIVDDATYPFLSWEP